LLRSSGDGYDAVHVIHDIAFRATLLLHSLANTSRRRVVTANGQTWRHSKSARVTHVVMVSGVCLTGLMTLDRSARCATTTS